MRLFGDILRFLCFFGLIGFVLICSFFLFFNGISLPPEIIEKNAKITFFNTLLLTAILMSG